MESAASKTYISRRMLDRYSEQRRQQQQEKQVGHPAPVVPKKIFSEDNASNLAPIEEEKKQELEQTDANLVEPIPEKNESDLSSAK